MSVFTNSMSAAEAIAVIFNGPAIAGIGATTDAGLTPDRHHVLRWDPKDRTSVSIGEQNGQVTYSVEGPGADKKIRLIDAMRQAMYNVATVFQWDTVAGAVNAVSDIEKTQIKNDMIAILYIMSAYGYYDNECRKATTEEVILMDAIQLPSSVIATIVNMDTINRASTFILARMHTKYQTNHVLGGSPMQASMASAVRAFYNVNPATARSAGASAKVEFIAKCLHWALHPANERLLIPAVINRSRIYSARVHSNGPPITVLGKEEYFAIRANTPPASTHHFYVAAAAVRHLAPLKVLEYLPSKPYLEDIKTGWSMIHSHGASLHPAARHWGLDHITCNQKIVEPICADLGYAIRKLMPNSSLAASPILIKEDALDASWKSFIDSLRAAMDDRGKEMLSDEILKDIKESLLPTKTGDPNIADVVRLMITSQASAQVPQSVAPQPALDNATPATEADRSDSENGIVDDTPGAVSDAAAAPEDRGTDLNPDAQAFRPST